MFDSTLVFARPASISTTLASGRARARRAAIAQPAGPAPTMTQSAEVGAPPLPLIDFPRLSCAGATPFQLRDQWRQVALERAPAADAARVDGLFHLAAA